MADEPKALTEQQLRFCMEYAADPNATQAYRRAFKGVTYKTANVEGSRLLANPSIQAELEAARKDYRRHCRVSFARIVREIAAIAHADPADIWTEDPEGNPVLRPWAEISPAARKTIQSIKLKRKRLRGGGKDDVTDWEVEEVEVKQHSKDAALDKLCRHLGITKDGAALEKLLERLEGDPTAVPPGGPAGGPAQDG
jgi:phage terminase small subunit